ncbi:MAG: biotin--[acetyl-CoA-carboxylase] ligase [Spirochaetaceae bacterium]|jgi:BirA family biotin operon repressor/biotin-[acetyl-CoA-carboxylase] ligase|nr:biotin--[acetyl-CoA-carboxylase] ligase [Spirochaetaceae bacterium]
MTKLEDIKNHFGEPVYYMVSCGSTMDDARRLAVEGARHGTALMAGFQTRGRGRRETRHWTASAGKNLTFTLILRYSKFSQIPEALTLRSGIAVVNAIAAETPTLDSHLAVKWPNDVMLNGKKCAGIIAENDGGVVLLGIGLNIMEDFSVLPPENTSYGVTSIASELAAVDTDAAAFYANEPRIIDRLLEKVLFSLCYALSSSFDQLWRAELEKRLYMKGEAVRFAAGGISTDDNSPLRVVSGTLAGIGEDGAVLILTEGEPFPQTFLTGEFVKNF